MSKEFNTAPQAVRDARKDVEEGWLVPGTFTAEDIRAQLIFAVGASEKYCAAYIAEAVKIRSAIQTA